MSDAHHCLAQNRCNLFSMTLRQRWFNHRIGYLQILGSRAFEPAKRSGPIRLLWTVLWFNNNHTHVITVSNEVSLCPETQKQTVTEPGLWKDLRTKVHQTVNLKLHQYMGQPCDLDSTQFCDTIREIWSLELIFQYPRQRGFITIHIIRVVLSSL